MKNIFKCLSIATLAFTLFACKKDAEPTKTELFTAHAWKVTAAEATINGTKQDFYATYEACEKDDFTTYKTDKTVINDNGPTKCDPSDPQTDQAKWQLLANETKLELTVTDGSSTTVLPYDIVELTADKIILKFTTGTFSATTTFGRK